MAKYEAGQMWTTQTNSAWIAVLRIQSDGEAIIWGSHIGQRVVKVSDLNDWLFDHTLTNPRGLREAAEAVVKKWDSDTEEWSTEKAVNMLRAALEQKGND